MNIILKPLLIGSLVGALMINPILIRNVYSEEESSEVVEYQKGFNDGYSAGMQKVSGALWFFAGCFLTWVGVLLAYLIVPEAPLQLGKKVTQSYLNGYRDGYKEGVKKAQTKMAWIGCGVGAAVTIIVYILLVAAEVAILTSAPPYATIKAISYVSIFGP